MEKRIMGMKTDMKADVSKKKLMKNREDRGRAKDRDEMEKIINEVRKNKERFKKREEKKGGMVE